MIRKLGITAQLVIAFLLVSVIAIVSQLVITSRTVSRMSTDDSLTFLLQTATTYAGEFQSFFNQSFKVCLGSKASLEALRTVAGEGNQPPDRRLAMEALKASLLENSKDILAIWTAWEPNAFDGRDSEFQGRAGHDKTGRFVPYYAVAGERIELTALIEYDQPGPGDYYQLALKSGRPTLLEPYLYDVNGGTVLITSVALPLKDGDGKTVGVAGLDVSLADIGKMVANIKPMGVGQIILISPQMSIAGHSNPSLVGRMFQDTPRGLLLNDQVRSARQSGRFASLIIEDGWAAGQDAVVVIYPFATDLTSENWTLITLVPLDKILEKPRRLTKNGLLAGLVVLGVAITIGLLSVKFIIGGLTKRIMRVVVTLNTDSDKLSNNAREISSSSQHIADGAQTQATSLEETAAALEEIASMSKRNADNAQDTSRTVEETISVISSGGQSMRDMSKAMAEINESTAKIGTIIKNVEEIAFQTRLLALNAAVEAARAGEAGAGFAVVAEEVRNLAMRSADSAQNTAELIEHTISRIKSGAELAEDMKERFIQIETGSTKIRQLVAEINSAATEQDVGINQVNLAMVQVDKVAQENMLTVSSLAEHADRLNNQAEELGHTIEQLLATIGHTRNQLGN